MARKRRSYELRLSGKTARFAGAGFGVLLLVACIGCVLYTASPDKPTEPDAPPARFKPEPLARLDRIEGWIPSWTDEAAIAREAAAAGFTDLLFFHGTVAEDGSVKLEDEKGLAGGLANIGRARSWLTVTNHGKSLATPLGAAGMSDHVDSLLAAFKRSGCMHLDLDYESLTRAQAEALLDLANMLKPRMPRGAELAYTLQPVDSALRPEQRPAYRRLMESPHVYTMRVMMYDYHWRTSLPGALCPMPAFERLIREWAEYAHKLTMCLPLYGYNWPRPEDTSIPRADVVTLRDVPNLAGKPGFDAVWMRDEAELAVRYSQDGVTRMVAAPSYQAIQRRVEHMLDWGVPAVSFWQLSCASPASVAAVCKRNATATENISFDQGDNWNSWLEPFKRRVCKIVIADGSMTLDEIAAAHGVSRSNMFRFNEHIDDGKLAGRTVYVPLP